MLQGIYYADISLILVIANLFTITLLPVFVTYAPMHFCEQRYPLCMSKT